MTKVIFLINEREGELFAYFPELIADNIQTIDDEFLQWVVQNSNCEYVEIEEKTNSEIEKELDIYGHDEPLTEKEYSQWLKSGGQLYKLIIPTEQPPHDYSGVHLRHCYQGEYEDLISSSTN